MEYCFLRLTFKQSILRQTSAYRALKVKIHIFSHHIAKLDQKYNKIAFLYIYIYIFSLFIRYEYQKLGY